MCNRDHTPKAGLELAIAKVSEPGPPNASKLARIIKVRPQAIFKWRRKGYVPLERVPAVSAASGLPACKIRPDRPDFFPPMPEVAA